jgi:hypothetical protein
MLTKNIYGVNLSNYFNNAIEATAQNVKPKITIDLLDSRHITLEDVLVSGDDLVSVTNTDAHTIKSEGSIGYYCTERQMINGYERESFTWAVTDALDKNGKIITADGTWHCMPTSLDTDSNLDGDYEYGWWSKTRSQANGVFASSPIITFAFEERKVNKIRVTTSEYYGQVKSFRVKVKNSSLVDILDKTFTLNDDEYYKEIYLNSNSAIASSFLAKRIEITILSTKNGLDYARIHEISPIYELDITDYVIDYSISRARDIHESNLPIGGSSSPKITLKLDNTGKDWNIFNNSSLYGKYMEKDLKIKISTGWRIKKTNDVISNTVLRSNMSNSASSFTVDNSNIFPTGGVNNNFIVTINPNKENREVVLCNAITSTNTISVSERGVGQTDAGTHAAGSVVTFDPYEYVSMGEFYVDEWSSSSSDMTVSVSASDWTKYLTEKKLTNGFLLEDKTVSEAVGNLLSRRNFPKADFKQVLPYSRGVSQLGGVARYSFSEDSIDKNGNTTTLAPGLRCRFWGMREGKELNYKTIKADALEKNLSVEERIKGINSYVDPDFTANSPDISLPRDVGQPSTNALNLTNYTFASVIDSATYTKYFNGIVDGYFFSTTLSSQSLVLDITNGGGRIYLDDLLIGESNRENSSVSITSIPMNLTPGVPYRLKIEFFHGSGNANFSMSLHSYLYSTSTKTLLPATQFRSVVARDGLGSRNLTGIVPSTYSINNVLENHHQNDGFIQGNAQLSYSQRIDSDNSDKGILLIDDAYIRIPTHSSIAIKEEDFTIELLAKFNDGHFNIGDGEYLSSWANSNPTNGFEFYYNNESSHGFKIKTTGPTTTTSFVSDDTDLEISEFYHIVATYKVATKTISYYINGELKDTDVINGEIATNIFDTTIGGRGAFFTTPATVTRTNLITNPSFEVNTTGWTPSSCTVARITSDFFVGAACAQTTSTATSFNNIQTALTPVTPNLPYTFSAYAKNVSGSTRNIYIAIQWFTAAGVYISETNSGAQGTTPAGSGWVRRNCTGTAPATATQARLVLLNGQTGISAGWLTSWDGVLFEQSSTLLPYFDGVYSDTYAGYTLASQSWNGTAHNSTSTSSWSLIQEIGPSSTRQFIIDEYAIYKKCLTSEEILDRYISSQVEYVAIFPYLYSEQEHLRGAIDEITLADLGRFYIDEEGYGRYEHYNRFFEPSISQHAVNQYNFSDDTNILDASLNVQIQTNKVVVKISSTSKLSDQPETLWSADDGVSLGVVKLQTEILTDTTGIRVSTTNNPVFANVGFLAFTKGNQTEIVRYGSKSENFFLDLERGKFGTPILDEVPIDTKIREARYYEVTYDKKPAVTVLSPIATGIIDDEPNTIDILKFENNPYTARLIVSASANVAYDTHVYLQGEDPRTGIVSGFAIYGIPVISVQNTVQVTEKKESLSENIRKYGLKELTIESPYITSEEHAQKLARFIIDKVSDPVPIITINTMCVPKIQLGDRIRIASLDAFDIYNQDYWVISQEFSYGESISQSLTLRKVV